MFNYNTAGPGGGPLPRLDATAPVADYPYGKAKNDDPAGSNTGTPIQIETLADSVQGMYACLVNGGVVPNGQSENVNNSDLLRALKNMFFDVGDIKLRYSETNVSGNWLAMNGAAFNPVDYPELSVFLGGSTMPDWRGLVPACFDSGQTEFDAINKSGGAKTHDLQESEIPAHTHGYTKENQSIRSEVYGTGTAEVRPQNTTEVVATAATGGSNAHNNLQPYTTAQYFMKAK